jgi:hypothetical protein
MDANGWKDSKGFEMREEEARKKQPLIKYQERKNKRLHSRSWDLRSVL